MTPDKDILRRCHESLSWMITDLKFHFDVDKKGEGGYSEQLLAAIELQKELEEYLQGSENHAKDSVLKT